jgi:hypothetical protein
MSYHTIFFLHRIGEKLNLRTKFVGRDKEKRLVINTKITPNVLKKKLLEGNQHFTEKYEIILPPFLLKKKTKRTPKL